MSPARSSIRSFPRPESALGRLFRRLRPSRALRGSTSVSTSVSTPATASTGDSQVLFRCNICGRSNSAALAALQREQPSCAQCGSTVRARAMVHLLTSELLGYSVALPDMPPRVDLCGIGLSDAEAYARPLARKFAYTNTYFHAEPMLDIANVALEKCACFDFILASDVFTCEDDADRLF